MSPSTDSTKEGMVISSRPPSNMFREIFSAIQEERMEAIYHIISEKRKRKRTCKIAKT